MLSLYDWGVFNPLEAMHCCCRCDYPISCKMTSAVVFAAINEIQEYCVIGLPSYLCFVHDEKQLQTANRKWKCDSYRTPRFATLMPIPIKVESHNIQLSAFSSLAFMILSQKKNILAWLVPVHICRSFFRLICNHIQSILFWNWIEIVKNLFCWFFNYIFLLTGKSYFVYFSRNKRKQAYWCLDLRKFYSIEQSSPSFISVWFNRITVGDRLTITNTEELKNIKRCLSSGLKWVWNHLYICFRITKNEQKLHINRLISVKTKHLQGFGFSGKGKQLFG